MNGGRTTRFTRARKHLIILALFAMVVSGSGCAFLPSQAGKSLPGLHNFGVVDEGKVYRSAQPEDPIGYRTFRLGGGKTVVNLRNDRDEKGSITRAGLAARCFKLKTGDPPTVGEIEDIVDIIADPENQPVLVHCRIGQDRTGLVVASYRIIEDRWTYDEAYEELKAYAFGGVEVHRGIVKRLQEVAARHERRS